MVAHWATVVAPTWRTLSTQKADSDTALGEDGTTMGNHFCVFAPVWRTLSARKADSDTALGEDGATLGDHCCPERGGLCLRIGQLCGCPALEDFAELEGLQREIDDGCHPFS